jgi:hypothetical protein
MIRALEVGSLLSIAGVLLLIGHSRPEAVSLNPGPPMKLRIPKEGTPRNTRIANAHRSLISP